MVETDSQTKNIEGNKKIREKVAAELKAIGGVVERDDEKGMTLVRFRPKNRVGEKLLLLAHTDTVEPANSFRPTFTFKDGKIFGAGVADMKGGIVVMLAALKVLHAAGTLQNRFLTVMLTSDEEVGSPKSRLTIETQAKLHDRALVFESGKLTESRGGGLTLGRKGILGLEIEIFGRTAHSGVAHYDGIDAGAIASGIVHRISQFTDYEKGVTSNIGVLSTNEKPADNKFIYHVKLQGEIRFWKEDEAQPLQEKVALIIKGAMLCNLTIDPAKKVCSDYELKMTHRPASPVSEENKIWFQTIAGLGLAIGLPLDAVTSGGASDMNLLVAAGLKKSVDSMGLLGGETHSPREWGDWNTFLDRVKWIALTIQRVEDL